MTSETEYETDARGITGIPEECQTCYGKGIYYGETCPTCGGYGYVCYEPDME